MRASAYSSCRRGVKCAAGRGAQLRLYRKPESPYTRLPMPTLLHLPPPFPPHIPHGSHKSIIRKIQEPNLSLHEPLSDARISCSSAYHHRRLSVVILTASASAYPYPPSHHLRAGLARKEPPGVVLRTARGRQASSILSPAFLTTAHPGGRLSARV